MLYPQSNRYRHCFDLSGFWEIRFDPENAGQAAGWSATGESAFLARERHLRALATAREHLSSASAQTERWELFAEELRLAHEALGSITGAFGADDLLGEIFSRFCIGK